MQNKAGYAASLCIPKYYHQPPSSRGERGGGWRNQGMEETKTTIAFLNDFRRFFYIYSTTELARNVIYKKNFKEIFKSIGIN